ncbi:MAG: hypothetical protein AABY22_28955, partial [Nanoarchaeota archaeon]
MIVLYLHNSYKSRLKIILWQMIEDRQYIQLEKGYDSTKNPFGRLYQLRFIHSQAFLETEPVFREMFDVRDSRTRYGLFDEQKRSWQDGDETFYEVSIGELYEAFGVSNTPRNAAKFFKRYLIKSDCVGEFLKDIENFEKEYCVAFWALGVGPTYGNSCSQRMR